MEESNSADDNSKSDLGLGGDIIPANLSTFLNLETITTYLSSENQYECTIVAFPNLQSIVLNKQFEVVTELPKQRIEEQESQKQSQPPHRMTTRSKSGIHKPKVPFTSLV